MKYIYLGAQCISKAGIQPTPLRNFGHPLEWIFDELWTPSQTVLDLFHILLEQGIDDAVEFILHSSISTTLEIVSHYPWNTDYYKKILQKRFLILLNSIHGNEPLTLIYADAEADDADATDNLLQLGLFLEKYQQNIQILYFFCSKQSERSENHPMIQYIPFDYPQKDIHVKNIIEHYLNSLCHVNLSRV